MPLHDIHYQHWEGVHVGVWGRRCAVAWNGLAGCLQNKWIRQFAAMGWIAALVMSAILFMVGQLLVADSIVVQWAGTFNPQLQMLVRGLTTWLEKHPEISVATAQNLLFYYFCILLLPLSIFSLGLAMPFLITRDLASNAIIIYSSKAISRGDYLLGKFSTAFGLVVLTWFGPLCAAWFIGNLLAPDWRFFWHSRAVLAHLLFFGLTATAVLSLLALGVSAIARKEKSTAAFWYMWWVIGGVIAPIAMHTQPELRHLSFNYNLNQVALAIFRPGTDIRVAQDNIPFLGDLLKNIRPQDLAALNSPAIAGALLALLVILVLAAAILAKRVKPE